MATQLPEALELIGVAGGMLVAGPARMLRVAAGRVVVNTMMRLIFVVSVLFASF